jgi:hypothetical protein
MKKLPKVVVVYKNVAGDVLPIPPGGLPRLPGPSVPIPKFVPKPRRPWPRRGYAGRSA